MITDKGRDTVEKDACSPSWSKCKTQNWFPLNSMSNPVGQKHSEVMAYFMISLANRNFARERATRARQTIAWSDCKTEFVLRKSGVIMMFCS